MKVASGEPKALRLKPLNQTTVRALKGRRPIHSYKTVDSMQLA
jgi:hypothetical protein